MDPSTHHHGLYSDSSLNLSTFFFTVRNPDGSVNTCYINGMGCGPSLGLIWNGGLCFGERDEATPSRSGAWSYYEPRLRRAGFTTEQLRNFSQQLGTSTIIAADTFHSYHSIDNPEALIYLFTVRNEDGTVTVHFLNRPTRR